MKAIVTKQNDDGTFDEVGMGNRFVTASYKTKKNLIRYNTDRDFKRTIRFEIYHDSINGELTPFDIVYINN